MSEPSGRIDVSFRWNGSTGQWVTLASIVVGIIGIVVTLIAMNATGTDSKSQASATPPVTTSTPPGGTTTTSTPVSDQTRPTGEGVPATTGGETNTWTNYTNAGGRQGQTIPRHTTVLIACKLHGFAVANGNTWWYRIAQSPWNNEFYASADAFYNNGQTSGDLRGTPWFDPKVPNC